MMPNGGHGCVLRNWRCPALMQSHELLASAESSAAGSRQQAGGRTSSYCLPGNLLNTASANSYKAPLLPRRMIRDQ